MKLLFSYLLFWPIFRQVHSFEIIITEISGTLSVDTLKLPADARELVIGSNQIEVIETGAICTTSTLQTVKIDFSSTPKPPTLHQDMFKNCENLTELSIFGNKKKRTQLNKGVFENFASLEVFTAQFFNARQLTMNFFSGANSLTKLTLEYCKIHKIDPGSFDGLDKLESLSLKHNLITTIQPNVFKKLSQLKELFFYHNKIAFLNRNGFDELFSLERLNIGYNKIGSMDDEAFHDLKNLTELSLFGNKIVAFSENLFKSLESLKTLDLSFNNITTLSWDFHRLCRLEYLRLDVNHITSFDADKVFKAFPNLKKIEIGHNASCNITRTFERELNKRFGSKVVDTGIVVYDYDDGYC